MTAIRENGSSDSEMSHFLQTSNESEEEEIALMQDDIRQFKQISPPSLSLKMQILNFIMKKIPKQQRQIEYPHENNTKVPQV